MNLDVSLKNYREALEGVYLAISWRKGVLERFLIECQFFSCVLSAIKVVGDSSLCDVKKELNTFLSKAKTFSENNLDYQPSWPNPQREGIVKYAYLKVFSGQASSEDIFTVLVALVSDVKNLLDLYEAEKIQ